MNFVSGWVFIYLWFFLFPFSFFFLPPFAINVNFHVTSTQASVLIFHTVIIIILYTPQASEGDQYRPLTPAQAPINPPYKTACNMKRGVLPPPTATTCTSSEKPAPSSTGISEPAPSSTGISEPAPSSTGISESEPTIPDTDTVEELTHKLKAAVTLDDVSCRDDQTVTVAVDGRGDNCAVTMKITEDHERT